MPENQSITSRISTGTPTGRVPLTGKPCNLDPRDTLNYDANCDVSASASTCNQGADGGLLSIYNPSTSWDLLYNWYNVINPWMEYTYTPASATATNPFPWCVPPESSLGFINTDEDYYIRDNSPAYYSPMNAPAWGDLPHVITCLDYNAGQDSNASSD